MSKKGLQKRFTSLIQEQLKGENQTTQGLVIFLLLQVITKGDLLNPEAAITKKLDAEIQKMIDSGKIDPIEDEDFEV